MADPVCLLCLSVCFSEGNREKKKSEMISIIPNILKVGRKYHIWEDANLESI